MHIYKKKRVQNILLIAGICIVGGAVCLQSSPEELQSYVADKVSQSVGAGTGTGTDADANGGDVESSEDDISKNYGIISGNGTMEELQAKLEGYSFAVDLGWQTDLISTTTDKVDTYITQPEFTSSILMEEDGTYYAYSASTEEMLYGDDFVAVFLNVNKNIAHENVLDTYHYKQIEVIHVAEGETEHDISELLPENAPANLIAAAKADGWKWIVNPHLDGRTDSTVGTTDVNTKTITTRWACSGSVTAAHEIGHLLDMYYYDNHDNAYASKSEEFVNIYNLEKYSQDSEDAYNNSDSTEYFASSYALYILALDNLKEHSPKTYDYIDRIASEMEDVLSTDKK